MNNSPTEGESASAGLPTQPTGDEQIQQPAEQSNQDANSREQSQGSVSDDTANQQQAEQKQTQQNEGGGSKPDDGLANFAKSQNIDLETASDDVKRLLKVALDNQKAARSNAPSKSIADTTKELGGTDTDARVAQLEYERTTDKFWAGEGRDESLEPRMVEILNEKAKEYGKEYAFNLSRDLDTLYGLAQLKSGATKTSSVDVEAIRREERESINRQMSAGAPQAHASAGGQNQSPKITTEWIRNEYDPRNPDHIKMMEEAGLR